LIFSIVVPCFNEDETLKSTHARLSELVKLRDFARFEQIELVYVNDGSRDHTATLLNQFAKNKSNPKLLVRVVHFSRNFGHSNAVLAGLKVATGDYVAIVDADLQDPPELLAEMYTMLDSDELDVVYGQRLSRQSETVFKRITAWAFYRLLNGMTGVQIPKDTGDFRVMSRPVVQALLQCGEHDPFLRGLVAWLGFVQRSFPYHRQPREFGQTKYPFKKMLQFAVQAILSFSTTPLRFAIYLGFSFLFGSVLLGAWAINQYLHGHTVAGWASIVVLMSFGQALTLIVLGVVGLYIAQIHVEVRNRPRYVVNASKASSVELVE
jgi:polyisoprenyl-phosphate glycosyltransferase